jgi:hypothetical protein
MVKGIKKYNTKSKQPTLKNCHTARSWWLISLIVVTQEAEIWNTEIQSQTGKIVQETIS